MNPAFLRFTDPKIFAPSRCLRGGFRPRGCADFEDFGAFGGGRSKDRVLGFKRI
jgi:hypothetical protein